MSDKRNLILVLIACFTSGTLIGMSAYYLATNKFFKKSVASTVKQSMPTDDSAQPAGQSSVTSKDNAEAIVNPPLADQKVKAIELSIEDLKGKSGVEAAHAFNDAFTGFCRDLDLIEANAPSTLRERSRYMNELKGLRNSTQ